TATAPTQTPAGEPTLTLNGSTDTSVTWPIDGPGNIEYTDIPFLAFYQRGDCAGSVDGNWTFGSHSFISTALWWHNNWAEGTTFSVQGFDRDPGSGGVTITTCRTVTIDLSPTATSEPPTATSTSTATSTPEVPTATPTSTATATTTPGPYLTINGSADPEVHVLVSDTLTIVWDDIPALRLFLTGGCAGGYVGYWEEGVHPNPNIQPASNWTSPGMTYSFQGYSSTSELDAQPITTCRTLVIDTEPTPTFTATATATATAVQPTATATATATATTPSEVSLTVNGSTDTVVIGSSTGNLLVEWATIPYLAFYMSPSCQDPAYGYDDAGSGSISLSASAWQGWLGTTFSIRGLSASLSPITTCRTITFETGPSATATATITTTATLTATDVPPTETATATSTPTDVPATETATVAPSPSATIDPCRTIVPSSSLEGAADPACTTPTATAPATATATEVPATATPTASLEPPTETPTATLEPPTETPTATATATPETPTATSTETSVPPTATETATATATATATDVPATGTPTATVTEVPSTATATLTATATVTEAPSTATATATVTEAPSTATATPTVTSTSTEIPATGTPTATATSMPPTATSTVAVTPTGTLVPVGVLQVVVTTSDGGDIPAGTSWLLSQAAPIGSASGRDAFFAAQVAPDQGGTLATALPSGSLLPIANPVAPGTYSLTIQAAGYRPLVTSIVLDDAEGTTTVTVELIAVQVPTATSTTASPTRTVAPTRPAPTTTATATTGTNPVNGLPNTGAGSGTSTSWPMLLLVVGAGLAACAGAIGLRTRRR
ncbi:MAG: hypothetical protein ACTHQE_13445, partial [Thermomicrobiales bacterium]